MSIFVSILVLSLFLSLGTSHHLTSSSLLDFHSSAPLYLYALHPCASASFSLYASTSLHLYTSTRLYFYTSATLRLYASSPSSPRRLCTSSPPRLFAASDIQHLSKCSPRDPASTRNLYEGTTSPAEPSPSQVALVGRSRSVLTKIPTNQKAKLRSYATIKLRCTKLCPSSKPKIQAFLRVYPQIPYVGTEFEDPSTRAAQARTFEPRELYAYRTLSQNTRVSGFTPKLLDSEVLRQDPSGCVPRGFLVHVLWERVPGFQLGEYPGKADAFWGLGRDERDEIREVFWRTFRYWVRFRGCAEKKNLPWSDAWLAAYDLVEVPVTDGWAQSD